MTEGSLTPEDCYRLYSATRRALQRVTLEKNERRMMDVVLDCSLGWGVPWLKVTGKKDLETLTGILIKNQERTFEALKRMRMLDVREKGRELILEPLPSVRDWIVTHRIDERVYYAALSGLRHFNRLAQLEYLPQETTLNEQLGEISRGNAIANLKNLPAQGGPADTPGSPPRHVLPPKEGAPEASGDNRELVNEENEPRVGGPEGPPHLWVSIDESTTDAQAEELLAAANGQPGNNCGQNSTPDSREVLTAASTKSTHGKYLGAEKPPDPGRQVLTVSTKSTHGEYRPPAKPPDEGAKVLTVSTKSTHGEYPINGLNGLNASSKKHLNDLIINALRRCKELARENYFVSEASPDRLRHYLDLAGVFAGPPGQHFRKFWEDQTTYNTRAVERGFFDLLDRIRTEGEFSVKSAGAFIVDFLKRTDQLRYRKGKARP